VSEIDPRKDPRFRSFRAAAYGLHIAVVTVFCLAVAWHAMRSVAAMTPERPPPAEQVLSYRECLQAAEQLWKQLETERETLVGRTDEARKVSQLWMEFRTSWLRRLREQESRCALESRDRASLRTVFRRLEQVQDLYVIHAVQYANEVGGTVDSLRAAFDSARSSPAAGWPQ
jgi:hypothetical protein